MHSSGGVEIIRVFLRSRQAGICRTKAALPDASFGFDTSGKTLAESHHRKFVMPARRKSGAGFLMAERRLP